MFPYEWFLAILKAYVWNRAHPEGCIMECYTIEEVIECWVDYVKHGKWVGLPIALHEGRLRGRGRIGQKTFVNRDYSLVGEAHFSVLQKLMIVGSYIDEHLSKLQKHNTDHIDAWCDRITSEIRGLSPKICNTHFLQE
jgi:hypothetical protein